jgi:hypothetical protein
MKILKKKKISMKKFVSATDVKSKKINWVQLTILIALLHLLLTLNGIAQNAASATWPLTANGAPTISGTVSASNLALGSTLSSAAYSTTDGVTSSGWSDDASSLRTNEFYEYVVTTDANTVFTVTSITGEHSRTSGNWSVAIRYSTDNFATSTIVGSEFNINSSTSTAFSRTGLSYTVNPSTSFRVRIYAWESDGSNRRYRNRNIVISGTTCAAAPVASAQTFCSGATVASLVATGTSIKWYSAATGGTALASTTALATGNYFASQTVNSCESATRTSVSVTVNPIPTAITATVNNATICNGSSVTLGGPSSASGAIVNLGLQNFESTGSTMSYTRSGDGSTKSGTTSTSDRPSNISYATSGTEGYWLNNGSGTITFANVTSLPNDLNKKISFKLAALSIGSTSNGLEGSDFVHVEVSLDGGTTWSREATINGNNNAYWGYSSGTATAQVNYDGNNTATVFAPAGGGSRTTDGFSTVVVNLPANATQARVRISMGNGSNEAWVIDDVQITGDYPTYSWSSSPAGFTSTDQSPTASPTETTTYTLTSSFAACSATSTVTVTVNTTAAPTASAQTFCSGSTVANLVATGTSIRWYSASTGGAALASTTVLASGNYFASQTLNSCESATRTSVSVTVNTTAAPTASAQTFCSGSTVANLVATGTGIKWYSASTGGTALASTTVLASGNYFASQTLNSCESATRTSVAVTVNTTTAPTASAQTFCSGSTVANLVATGTGIKWYSASTGGTALATTTVLASGNYFASQTLNSCESATRRSVAVTVNTTAAPTASAQTFCSGSTVANLVATGTGIKWYSASTGGTALASTTALASGNYFASQTLNSCESATRTSVAVNLNPLPTTNSVTVCAGGNGAVTVTNLYEPPNSTSTGSISASAVTNNTTIGNTAWTNTNNALNGFANVTLQNSSSISNYLVATNFNFSQIPANAIIKGIRVSIGKYSSNFLGLVATRDNEIRLVKNGTIVGDNKANATAAWSSSSTSTTNYGTASDLWGTTWTVADIQNNNFGFAISARNNTANNIQYTANVGNIGITINYTVPGTINWYTAASGGTSIASGVSFNPVTVANSGLSNTFTTGTRTYYAEDSYFPGCRAAADFVIVPGAGTINGGGTVCSSTNTSSLSLTGNAAGNVQWQSSTDSINFNNITGATLSTYTANNLSATNYFRAVVTPTNTSCGIVQSPIVKIMHYASGSWIGSVSSNWNDPNNWCGGVPDSTTNVVIMPSNNAPIINTTNASVNNITVQNGATLSITTGNNLSVAGNITAVGAINNNPNSTLILNGLTTQVIPTITYANVINKNTRAAVFSNGDVTVTGIFRTDANTVTDLGTSKLNANVIQHSGILKLSGTAGDELPFGESWGGTVEYNNALATQVIIPGSYEKLRINGASKNIIAPISVTSQLELVSGTLNNATNSVTVANGGTIVRENGTLAAAPIFGNSPNSKVNIEYSGLDTVVSGNELLGTTGKIGNIKINSGSYKLQNNITADDITVLANAELDAANTIITSQKSNSLITINGTIKTSNPNGLVGNGTATFSTSNNPIFNFTNSTVEYYANTTQTISARADYNNLIIKGGGNKLMGGNAQVNGVLSLTTNNDLVAIENNTLTLNGTVTGAGRLKGSANAKVEIGGNGNLGTLLFDQTTDNTTNTLKSFNYNRVNGSIDLGNKLIIVDEVNPTNGTLNTNNNLTLRSNIQNTARIGRGNDAGNYINGEVIFERYVTANANRAWRMVTPGVTTNTTINANWQEGKVNTIVNSNVSANTLGYGVHITGAGGSSNGFDVTQTNSASLYRFDQTIQGWALITNTNVNTLNAKTGYLLFVRGSRDNISPINTTTGSSNVTLRAKGTLLQGTQTFSNLASNGGYSLVTNPFAAPINWASIYNSLDTSLFTRQVIIWDPNIGTRGGFVSILDDNIISNDASNLDINIQSGQAFFIKTRSGVTAPTFTVKEEHKSSTNNLDVFRVSAQIAKLKIQLRFTASNIDRSADGVTAIFANNYSNSVDQNDAEQIANWDEDIALLRNGKELSIESRKTITANDTLFLKIGNLRAAQANYRWVIQPEFLNLPGLTAFLEDAFTNTSTPISLTAATTINFTVSSNAASIVSNRFRIVFKVSAALPVTITQFKAQQKGNNVQLAWNTVNELNIHHYEVEKSTNAQQFTAIAKVMSTSTNNTNQYEAFDANVETGTLYYRLKITEKDGSFNYSKIVSINIGKSGINNFTIFPNPVKGNTIGLQLNNVEKGKYAVKLINSAGQVIYQSILQHNGSSASDQIILSNTVPAGRYQLELSTEKGIRMLQTLIKE